ncbi:MAG: efflux RND transporter periplasmic adaptor subunit [Bacteroidales bacterium]|nr:efflux RND transporter periplasmic adaptor subunit [Bacteroidales bacterium]
MKNIFPISISSILIIVISVLLLYSCKKKDADRSMEGEIPVEVALPIVMDVMLTETYPGYLQAFQTANLVARVSGNLEKILYQPGDYVSQGTLLFIIETTTYQDNVTQAEAALNEAQATLDYNKATYERTAEAFKSNAVSEISVIQTKANYDQSLAALKNAKASLETAKTNLDYCYVKAPFAGRVSKNNYDIGNFLNGNSSPTLAAIYQDDKVYVNFSVSDNQYLSLAIKNNKTDVFGEYKELTILPNAETNISSYKAQIDYFAPNIELSTGTINMRGVIENKDGLLRDGLYVKVVFPYKKVTNAIVIPDASIGTDQLGNYVYIVNDSSKVVQKRVDIGQLIDENNRIINSGIATNDKYVTTALLKVRSGMSVKPVMLSSKDEKHGK